MSKRLLRTCLGCEATFLTYPSVNKRYCTPKCVSKNAPKPKQVERICPTCNDTFFTTGVRNQRHCSIRCAHLMPLPLRPCPTCGETIPRLGRKPSLYNKTLCCSRKCGQQYRAKKGEQTLTCEYCGQHFTAKGPESAKGRRFCGTTCANRAIAKARTSRPQRAVERQRILRLARERLPLVCALCGWEEDVDACHIIPTRKGGTDTLDNITMLCPNHHRMFDRGAISANLVLELRHSESTPASTSS